MVSGVVSKPSRFSIATTQTKVVDSMPWVHAPHIVVHTPENRLLHRVIANIIRRANGSKLTNA